MISEENNESAAVNTARASIQQTQSIWIAQVSLCFASFSFKDIGESKIIEDKESAAVNTARAAIKHNPSKLYFHYKSKWRIMHNISWTQSSLLGC